MTSTKEHVDFLYKYHQIQSICTQLIKVTQSCDHDAIPMSFISKRQISEAASTEQNLDQLPPSYMYSVIFKDIILEIDHDDNKSMNTLVNFCRQQNIPEKQINLLQSKYHEKSPIWWYSKSMFLHSMLNRALRLLDMETMIKLGFFIRRLHIQLEQLHQEQSSNFQQAFTVYRGQELSQQDFQNLCNSKGGLVSFNNFLSTSKEKEVAMNFVNDSPHDSTENLSVIFIMAIDPSRISTSTTPFAMIAEQSAISSEQEMLFTMHTVFRVVEIKQMAENSRLWEVHLAITDDNDPQLSTLTSRIKQEINGEGWDRMGKLMLKVGHFDQAEELYNELLKNASTDSDRANIYYMLGILKDQQGKYPEAAKFNKKSLEIDGKLLPEDDTSVASTYRNIGSVYKNMGEYSKALEYFKKTIKIQEKSLSPTDPALATSYNDIGLLYSIMSEYSKALEFYEKSNKILEISLPANHPDLAASYNSFGRVYKNMGEYSKALEFYEKSNKILEISLHANHPDLATSYNNIGAAYYHMGEYSKALEFYEKSNKIWEISLPPTHPDLASSYNNIGHLYEDMQEYSKALPILEKALSIKQKSLPSTHPSIKNVLNAIDRVKEKL
ncbi:unnamed protein product [Rotaria socialis]|uniref:Uncharacterized protein n=2 Tax=Rotaria socialis TaxID=392032 RepID=A0A820QLW4_9BILA|nr:unnamed protein product [Rotaria socialis]